MTANSAIADVVKNSADWRTAATDLIAYYMENGLCFSSGEVAAELRTHRDDLKFSVLSVGEFVRDLFYGDDLQYDDGVGGKITAIQVPMTTTGKGRTQAGRQVFVYGPDSGKVMAHDFEVDIPSPPGQPAQAPAVTRAAPASGYPTQVAPATSPAPASNTLPPTSGTVPTTGVPITGRSAAKRLVAKVHTDRRLCVTRDAFEAFVHASGKSLRGGDHVYLAFDGDEAIVSLDNMPGSNPYSLSTHRGRVLFTHPDSNKQFQPGDTYEVKVSKEKLTVDLSTTI